MFKIWNWKHFISLFRNNSWKFNFRKKNYPFILSICISQKLLYIINFLRASIFRGFCRILQNRKKLMPRTLKIKEFAYNYIKNILQYAKNWCREIFWGAKREKLMHKKKRCFTVDTWRKERLDTIKMSKHLRINSCSRRALRWYRR